MEATSLDESIQNLNSKVEKLESKIASLCLGRRILMDLLIEQENMKNYEIQKLELEIKRLNRIIKKRH